MKKLFKIFLIAVVFLAGNATRSLFKAETKLIEPIRLISKVHAQTTYQYEYPQIIQCDYRWNMLQRIYKDCGIWPIDCLDMYLGGSWKTVPMFNVALNATQKSALDNLMLNGNPCSPPITTGTKYQILDLYENRFLIGQRFGITNFWIWYQNGGSTALLYFDNILNAGQKNKVSTEFANLLQEF